MNTTTRIVLGAPITLGAGAAIQHFVAGGLPIGPSAGIGAREGAAAALQIGASAGSFFLFHPVAGILGFAEAIGFLVWKAAKPGAPAVVPPAPESEAAPAPVSAPKLTTAQKITAAVQQYVPGLSQEVNQLFSKLGDGSMVLNVVSRNRDR